MYRFLPLCTVSALLLAACSASRLPTSQSGSAVSVTSVSSAANAGIDATGLGLSVPAGMKLEIFAKNLSGARDMVRDGFGNMWVSRTKEGKVTLLEIGSGGIVTHQTDVFTGLHNPHGLTVDPAGNTLYIAEETKIDKALLYTDAPVQTIATLPTGGRHVTRTIRYGPDDHLYVSIGSTCDTCIEKNPENGSIISMKPDGSDRKTVATGLRNPVFFDWSYVDGAMYATEMGRDYQGDTTPPDEIDRITQGSNYGWPYCYGDRVPDPTMKGTVDCASTVPPLVALPAHVAPLGLAFVPEEGWPEDWWYNLVVAEHGSWNSSEKVGYKLVRIPMDAHGNPTGAPVDFITGWLQGNAVSGRPVGLMIEPGGTLYISDDQKGVIYRLTLQKEAQ